MTDRLNNAPPPRPVNTSAADVLRELGVGSRKVTTKRKREVVAREAWRLSPDEIQMLHDAGTDVEAIRACTQ